MHLRLGGFDRLFPGVVTVFETSI